MNLLTIFGDGCGVLVIVLTLIQIAPVKINPWNVVAKCIGKAINKDVIDKIDTIENDVKDLQFEISQQAAINSRMRILRFGDELLHGTNHSKDHFDQTSKDIKNYNLYCRKHPEFENNVTEQMSKRIEEVYRELLKNNNFLS